MDTRMQDTGALLTVGERLIARAPLAMVLSDPNSDDNPLTYVNAAFERITGYSAASALGRNCRFLQGDDTGQPEAAELASAIAGRQSATVTLRNYRADGKPFLNRLMISPVEDADGELVAYLGIQNVISDEAPPKASDRVRQLDEQLEEMRHRVKNHLQMLSSLIRLQGRDPGADGYVTLGRRVDALALLYDEFSHPPTGEAARYDVVPAGGYVSRVANTVAALDGRGGIRVNIDADPIIMRSQQAAKLGLLCSELLSNAFEHAFDGREEGNVEIRLKQQGGDRVRLTVSDDGVGMGDVGWPENGNSGARIVRGLAQAVGGELIVSTSRSGTSVRLDFDNAVDTTRDGEGQAMLSSPEGDRTG
jgi:PAS domain S-box-containing protein